ncbi:MAG: trimeric autotransporter adhesin [Thermoanaerobaculia bacterium]|nr:trimeric autotransporter adhesin [Thermoanaerobaculia bacterium]
MNVRRVLLVLCLVLFPVAAFAAVSADMGITATDSPDPVAPDGNITYTVHVTNAGPSTATTAHLNVVMNGTLLWQSMTVPAGWSCPSLSVGFGGSFTCTAAALASGSDDTFTIVLNAGKAQFGVNNQTINQLFGVNAAESDPNNANNNVTVSTSYVAPHADMQITGSDSPDPVAPDGNITYTVNVTNAGPDATTNAHMNVVLNGTLLFQSMTVPAGWSCPSLSVGFGGSFTCTAANLGLTTSTFTIVLKAGSAQFGVNNQTINQLFTTNSDWGDPNNANNTVTVSTAYVAPHADMQITASDSPDPVAPDGNITYTVNVTNAGPDAATNAHMNVVLNNTLLWQSMTVPAGWTCPSLSVGNGASFTCTAASFGVATSVFTIVLKAGSAQFGVNNQTINQVFTTTTDVADPNNANNTATVSTAYVTPHADMQITASDSPDPVAPNGNITYTVNVTNAGPDAATSATMNVILNNTLLWQSMTVPAGWTCPALAVGNGASFTCTAASFGLTTSVFTIVLKAGSAQFGNTNQTINQLFTTGTAVADTNNANNAVTVSTSYVVPTANLAVTNSDAPDPVNSGGTITYTQSITNNGPDAAANANITESIGSGVTFQSIAAPAGWSCTTPAIGGTGIINCSTASLANAGSASFTVVVNVTAVSGSVSNTITGSSDASDTVPANNSAAATTTVTPPPSADLGITKSTPTTNAAPGAAVVYTIVVTNHGPDTATSVTMTDTLPATLLFQSINAPAGYVCTTPSAGTTGTISCTGSSLANGATATFTLNATSVSNANGAIANTASVSGTPSDPTPGNNSQTSSFTAGSADLGLTGSSGTNGGSITYTFGLTNGGPSNATTVVFTDTLPSSLRFQSITAPPGFVCTTPPVGTSGTITCTAPTFANGATGTFTLVTTAAPGTTGPITNSAGVSSATSDPNPGNSTFVAPAVTAPATSDVPALSTWALMLLAAILGAGALMKMR